MPKDSLDCIGKLLTGDEGRDAVHIAVMPMVNTNSSRLLPATAVNANGGCTGERVGIVDPFLSCAVQPGERFYCFLWPKSISSLRHVWAHPAFPEEGK